MTYGELAELVEGTSLLTRQGFTTLVGSNPTLSARLWCEEIRSR